MRTRLAWPTLLTIGAVMIGGGACWSSSSSTRAYATGGAGWSAAGRSGSLAGAGGVASSAGNAGLAGSAGSAGLAGSGGVAGSAGGTGAGGVAGSAGLAGAGGVAGSRGSAGSSGVADGGVSVDGAMPCDDLHNQYAADLLVARRCTVDAGGQCAHLVATSIPQLICGPTGGQTYVNDVSALGADWVQAFALHCGIAIECGGASYSSAIPDGGTCAATDGGGGLCTFLSQFATSP